MSPEARGRRTYWTKRRILDAIQLWALENGGRPPTGTEWRKATPHTPTTQTVRERFGSWGFAIELAGFRRPRAGFRAYWHRRRVSVAILAWTHMHGRPPRWSDWMTSTPEHPHAQTVSRLFGGWRAGITAALEQRAA